MNLANYFNQQQFDKYVAYLKSTNLSSSSLQRKLSSIATFQKFLVKKNIIPPVSKNNTAPTNISNVIIPSKNKLLNFFKSFSLKQIPQTSKFYKYLLISSLIIIVSGIGVTLYRQAITKAKKNLAYTTASTPVYANRFLSFQGRLTDSAGNPINSSTAIVFELYNTENIGTGTSLYTSATGNSQTVLPDENGIFSVTIGKTHGIEIPNSVFTQNSAVYLQITAGGEVMDPRQPIATVAYAVNSESLQGLQPSASGLKDTVLVIDGQGNLNLGETSPTIKSTSGTLGIEGQAILLTASNGSGGDIEINPDASGIIKLTTEGTGSTAVGGFIDATNANLSIGNLFNADINNTNRGYNFISFNNYDIGTTHSSTRFSIDASGNTYIGGTLSPTTISIGNTILTSSASELNLLDGLLPTSGSIIYGNGSNLSNTSVGASGQILMSNGNGSPFWVNPNTAGIGVTYDAVNGITLAGAQFKLGGALTENTRLNIGSTEVLYFSTSGNIGMGTTSPTAKLSLVVPEEYVIGSTSYSIGESQTSSSTFSVAGIGQSWQGDENKYEYTLPFTFPFFGVGITNFQVSTNGYIWVDPTNNNDPDYNPTSSGFSTYSAIAPLWGDLVTDGSGQANEDIYIDESISNQVTITWVGEIYGSSSNVVNFSVTLHSNGTIEYKYGSGNTNLEENGPESGLVFVGDGKGHYQELSISGASNQTNTNDVFVTINENVTQGIAKSTIFSIGSTGNNYLTLNNDGHLGLGTTNPLYILDVADDVNFRTNVNIGGTATFGNDLNLNNNFITNGTQPGESNFIGNLAGLDATNAFNSNFFGSNAGSNASGANNSNFLGLYAGSAATGASSSNFLGNSAGSNAVMAHSSNFFGYQSGYFATNANNSNFFGSYAGQQATNASNSNFFGQSAGQYDVGASYSNFFGYQSGLGASYAANSNFFGYQAGLNAANAHNSNFFGQNAGVGASYAYYSNFIGRDAGIGASRASNSNFIGYQAGKDAINATSANFFGNGAGVGASGAFNSNFFGLNAGIGASDAYQSNFLGGSAGSLATHANDSNFFGSNAGRDAVNASMSNFFSQGAGIGASNAHDSNFFGFNAGIGASNAYHSNFLGYTAGKDAINAYYSNFFGYQAGLGGTSASYSNFLGLSAGLGATNASNANFLGQYSGRNAINASNSNFSGYYAGYYAMNASYSNFFGQNAGRQAYNASYSNFFGVNSGYGATNANTSNFFGQDAGYLATGANNSNFLGRATGYAATNASYSNFFGLSAGMGATNAANSIFIGTYAGYNDAVNTGSTATAIAIGRYAGTGGYKNSIAIGRGVINTAEQQANIGNVLYLSGIYNSDTQSGAAVANGKVGIGTTNPQSKLSVIGSISGDNLVLAGNNQLSGFSGFNSFLNSSNGLGTNGLIRLTTEGNLSNIGSIQAGQLNITSGGTFGVATTYPAGTNPDDLIVDDFNSDGITDLAVIYNNTGYILFTNDGSGNLGVGVSYPASYSDEIASGDLNGDGLIDIVTSNGNGFNVFLNQGQGIFDTGTTYPYSPLLNGGTIIADINEDGKSDLILSNSSSDKFTVFKNQGNGTFGVGSTYSSNTICDEPSTPSVADYNGDSKKDISIACYAGSRFAVFLNQGNGSFSVGVTYPTALSYGSEIASADFDGDGKPDVVVDHGPSETISIFKNQGNGTFDTGTTYPIKDTSHFMTTTDFTGDGKPDIALSDHYNYTIETFINSGNGNLDVGPTYPKSGNGLGPIDFGDFNHDGKNDIIAVNRTSGSVAIYLNNSTPTLFTNTTGNVGIGTTNPTKKLDVVGDIKLTGQLFVGTGFTGAAGQVLVSTGVGLSWATASGSGPTYTASTGITLVGSDIQLNLGYTPTWTGLHTFNGGIGVSGSASFGSDIDLNNFYITNGTQPGNSNFIGSYAGYNATNSHDSNFFGQNSGNSASGAYQSNFFGSSAGDNAFNAHDSNFFGYYAGVGASNAHNSNFFGQSAGVGASNAYRSNFFGQNAGQNAFNTQYSNFFGYNAGQYAYNANNSNFFGQSAGVGASNAYNSNFFGQSAGVGASNAYISNFFGPAAGQNATFAWGSNFFGYSVGIGASNANLSNFFGYEAGVGASAAYSSNFFGQYAGKYATGGYRANYFGESAGQSATNASYSNFFGYSAGVGASSATGSNFIGTNAGQNATTARYSNFFGNDAGRYATNANFSNFIGIDAGIGASNASSAIFIGSGAGYNDTVNTVSNGTAIAIGDYSGTGGFKNSIAIGHGVINTAEEQANIGNVLYLSGIYNSDTQSGAAVAAGKVGIGTTNPQYKLDVAGDGRFSTNLNIGGTLTISQGAQDGYVLTSDASGHTYWGVGSTASGVNYTASNGISQVGNDFRLNLGSTNVWLAPQIFTNGIGVTGTANLTNALNVGGTAYFANNVGIGTTSPIAKLHIFNSSDNSELLRFDATSGRYTSIQNYLPNGSYDNAGTQFYKNSTWGEFKFSNLNGDLLTINKVGNIGIGTTNPTSKLQVTGNIELGDGTTTQSLYAYNSDRSYNGQLELYNLATGNVTLKTSFDSGNIILMPGTTGKVGIGTTSPSYKLDVTGDGRFTSNLNIGGTLTLGVGASTGYVLTSDASGNAYWAASGGIGTTYAAGSGLTLSSNTFSLNLGSTNVWLAPQIFTNGIGVTGTASFSNDINLSNNYITNGTQPGNSNFIGANAGQNAFNANNSNFFGQSAGIGTSYAHDSNFFGQSAGIGASSAYLSNFFGNLAGDRATNARNSNFLGQYAGQLGTNARNSNFLGQYAGYLATNADNSNFFGYNAGVSSVNANNSNFFGYQSGYGASNASYSNFFGRSAGTYGVGASYSNFFGYQSGSGASMAANSIFIGTYAGYNDTVNTGSTATAIAIGRYAGTGGFKNSIAIGRGVINTAEQQANIGNVLYLSGIYNSDTQSGAAVAGGKVGIGTTNPTQTLTVAGDEYLTGQLFVGTGFTGAAGQVLVSTGVGLSWTTVSGGPTYTASTGITLVGSDIQLNLGSTNVWLAPQIFTNGIGVSNTANLSGNLNVGGTGYFANKVGIGTTDITGKLTVAGSSGSSRSVSIDNREIKFRGDSVAHMSIFGPDTGNSFITFQNTSANSATGTAGTDLFTIMSSGNVGIGTTNPSQRFQVTTSGANDVQYGIRLQNPNNSTTGASIGIAFANDTDNNLAKGALVYTGRSGYGKGDFLFLQNTDNDLSVPTLSNAVMAITNGGSVGIGTTAPTQKLDVAGKIALNGIQVLYRPSDMYNSLIIGDGGNNLSHTSGDQGYYNTFVGLSSGISNTSGPYNTALGSNSLYNNTQGYDNTASGGWSLFSNVTGYENAAFGSYSLYHNIDGVENTALGVNALFSNTTGSNNIGVGYLAGRYLANGSTGNSSPDYSMYLGYNTKSLYNNAQNEIVIGYNAIGNGSNSVVLGNDSITNTILKGNVGIGTTSPNYKLDVSGDINITGSYRVNGTPISSGATYTASTGITLVSNDIRLNLGYTPTWTGLHTFNGGINVGGTATFNSLINLNNNYLTNGTQPGDSNFVGYYAGLRATNASYSNFFGINAGVDAVNASSSNFFGYQAGLGASDATGSNFFGYTAGKYASNASQSNFFGYQAGLGASNAYSANFFGENAGIGASKAYSSNFFGKQSGQYALSAYNSNFFGSSAGSNAFNAANSNFFGSSAGVGASYAYNSNFLGQGAGIGASNADNSNFFGAYSGQYATNASDSNFFGNYAGQNAFNATYSNFIGYWAGVGASNANYSNFLGSYAGIGASNANNSNFFGNSAGNKASDAMYSNFFGENAGLSAATAHNSNFFGRYAGYNATNANTSNFFGYQSGQYASSANNSNFFGSNSGAGATSAYYSNFFGASSGQNARGANYSNFFGYRAGYNATNANYSNFFGYYAGSGATNASNSIFIGYYAGYNDTVNDYNYSGSSIAIGRYAGTGGFKNSITIGRGVINTAEEQANIGNVLYLSGIYNSDTQSGAAVAGGKVGIGTTNPGYTLDVAGDVNITGSYRVNGTPISSGATYTASTGITLVSTNFQLNLAYTPTWTGLHTFNGGINVGGTATFNSLINLNNNYLTNGTQPGNSNFIGYQAGLNADNAINSNFFGQSAGLGASNANNSNFFGYQAGLGASVAYYSNFFGSGAGQNAFNASFSNFFGYNAGQNAFNAHESNFFGYNAGVGASNADYSNFFGKGAGIGASDSRQSNFLGYYSGQNAINAYGSNFLGYYTGRYADNAYNSNFFGQQSGESAKEARDSNFFGYYAGIGASNAYSSNFFGSNAGQNASYAYYSNYLGYNAGIGGSYAHDSNFFGFNAGAGATNASNSSFFGSYAGRYATDANNSNFFGSSAGYNATNASNSNFFGQSAGSGSPNANGSNFIGYQAGLGASNASNSNFFGWNAGKNATLAANSNFFGYNAGSAATNAANSIFIGSYAGYYDTVDTTSSATAIAIGRYAGTGGFKNSIAIGRGVINTAEQQANIGNVLYLSGIYNSDTQSGAAVAGGKVGIGTTNPVGIFQIDIGNTRAFIVDSTGDIGIGNTAPTGIFQVNVGTSQSFIIAANGSVGIGTTVPTRLLTVTGNVGTTLGVALFQNTNTGKTIPTMVVQYGSSGTGFTGTFINFTTGANAVIGRIRNTSATAVSYATGGTSDFAEYVRGDEPTQPTDLIAYHGDKFGKAIDGQIIAGTHTNYGAFLGNEAIADEQYSLPLAMVGIVDLKVSSVYGNISAGDPIATSPFAGVGAKAIKSGRIVGHAIENYSNNNPNAIGTVKIIVQPTYYDSDINITSTGQIAVNYNVSDSVLSSLGYSGAKNEIESATYNLTDSAGNIVNKIDQFSQIASAKIKAGLISAKNIIADNIVTKNLISQKVTTDNIVSPLGNIDHLTTQDIQSTNVETENLVAQNVQTTQVTTDDLVADNATISGTLYADNIISREGSIGDLMTNKISSLREELQKLVAKNEATPSALLAESESWYSDIASDSATIHGDLNLSDNLIVGNQLIVNGNTQLGNTFINGIFNVGDIAIKDNLIETTNTALYIQPSQTGSVHIMGDTLVIADNGNVTINGNLSITGSFAAGNIIANEIQTNKLTAVESTINDLSSTKLNIATDSASTIIASESDIDIAISSAKVNSNATAGTATLPAGKTELIISTNKITPESMVYLTPLASTQNQVLYVKSKDTSSFTISLDNPLTNDIQINWWIIN